MRLQKGKKEKSYVVKKAEKVKIDKKHIGKKHPDVTIKNSIDKSIVRNIAKKN